jgi:hypothetical protein
VRLLEFETDDLSGEEFPQVIARFPVAGLAALGRIDAKQANVLFSAAPVHDDGIAVKDADEVTRRAMSVRGSGLFGAKAPEHAGKVAGNDRCQKEQGEGVPRFTATAFHPTIAPFAPRRRRNSKTRSSFHAR